MYPIRLLPVIPALLSAAVAVPAAAQQPPDEIRYRTEVLTGGMAQPMEFELLPDGRLMWIEIAGKVKLLDPKTKVVTEAATLPVWAEQESGLLGLALDPKFAENRWVYLLWSPKDYSGGQICRYVFDGGKLDLTSEKILLRFDEQRRECCHHAGCMEFGPDGCLYASTGDNTYPPGDSENYAPIDERPDHFPRDAQKSASNPGDLRGKIIRIRPKDDGTYEIPEGNLFPPGTAGTRPEIYVMGCRNPWRMTVDQKSGYVYWGEVGPDAGGDGPRGPRGYDEINQARKAGNFGWPYFIADNRAYTPWDFASNKARDWKWDPAEPVNLSPNNTGAKKLPPAQGAFIYWPYGGSDKWPELGSGGRTACAGAVFRYQDSFSKTDGFPAYYDNCLLFFDWERKFIKWARLDAAGNLVKIEPFTDSVKLHRPAQARFGSDGALYLMDYGSTWGANQDSKFVRISYQSGNLAPAAKASADRVSGPLPLALKLSSAGSTDPDREPLRYEWKLEPGGRVLSREAEPSVTLTEAGDFFIVLTVTDPHGASAQDGITVSAGNTQPAVVIEEPANGSFYAPGLPLKFRIRVTDAEDGVSDSNRDVFGARTLVTASPDLGSEDGALTLMKRSDCFNCHQISQKLVGPALLDIAVKYRGQAGAADASVERVLKGSQGVWGPLPMLPHASMKRQEVTQIVEWIYALKPGESAPVAVRAIEGEIPAPSDKNARGLVLDAAYTDGGHAPAGALTGRSAVTLRSPLIQAEDAAEIHGPLVLGSGSAGGGKFLGSIDHGHWIRLSGLHLKDIGGVKWRVSSAGSGGRIELRSGSRDGPLLSSVDVPNNGAWEKWEEKATPLQGAPGSAGDVFILFLNSGHAALMNLDSVEFLRQP